MKIKNKKKGATLISVIVLMLFASVFSLTLFSLLTATNLNIKLFENEINKKIEVQNILYDFKNNNLNTCDYYTYNVNTFYNEENENIIAAVATDKKNDNIIFYAICDFSNLYDVKTLCFQIENFYITKKTIENKEFYFLADIIKYKEV